MAARLMLLQPEWNRSCRDCQTWVYETDGARRGLPMLRRTREGVFEQVKQGDPPLTPCGSCPKVSDHAKRKAIEEGRSPTSVDAIEPEQMHFEIVEHFLTCDAVRSFPDDPWTRFFARYLRPVKDEYERRALANLLIPLMMPKS